MKSIRYTSTRRLFTNNVDVFFCLEARLINHQVRTGILIGLCIIGLSGCAQEIKTSSTMKESSQSKVTIKKSHGRDKNGLIQSNGTLSPADGLGSDLALPADKKTGTVLSDQHFYQVNWSNHEAQLYSKIEQLGLGQLDPESTAAKTLKAKGILGIQIAVTNNSEATYDLDLSQCMLTFNGQKVRPTLLFSSQEKAKEAKELSAGMSKSEYLYFPLTAYQKDEQVAGLELTWAISQRTDDKPIKTKYNVTLVSKQGR